MFKSKFKVVYDSLNDIYQVEERKWYSFLYWPTEYFYTKERLANHLSICSNLNGNLNIYMAEMLKKKYDV